MKWLPAERVKSSKVISTTATNPSELRSCVKVEVAVPNKPHGLPWTLSNIWVNHIHRQACTHTFIMHARTLNGSLIVMDKVTRQCPQTTTFLKRRKSRSGIEPRPFCFTAGPDWLTLGTWSYRCIRSPSIGVCCQSPGEERCRSRVDCFVAELFLNSCFPDTAVQTAVSWVHALLGTGGVPTSSTSLFWRWLTGLFGLCGSERRDELLMGTRSSPFPVPNKPYGFCWQSHERRRVYDVCHLRHE